MIRLFPLLGLTLCLGACAQSPDAVRVVRYEESEIQGSLGRHTVYDHETVWGIAQNYRVSMRDVIEANSLNAPFILPVGTRLLIPAPRDYVAKRGDTLLRVSRMFGTTTTELARLNGLVPPYKVSAGTTLKIPGQGREPVISGILHDNPKIAAVVTPVYKEPLAPSSPKAPTPTDRNVVGVASVNSKALSPVYEGQSERQDLVFVRPVSGNVISGFGPTKDGLHNDGINIKAPKGTGVKAAERGQVVYVGNQIEGYGQMVLIKHAKGYITAYAHLERALVKKGDHVSRGQAIGTVGSSGHVNSPQLHFEIRKDRDVLDPQRVFGKQA